jgi:hypothetical protein
MMRSLATFSIALCLVAGCDAFKAPTKKVAADAAPVAKEEATPEMERVKAGVGVGKKGASLRGDDVNKTIAAAPLALFEFKEKAVFDFQIKPALELYNADKGFYPKTHEDFMKDIIEANMIKLPELFEGERYVYEPETHQLMVERPVKSAPNP